MRMAHLSKAADAECCGTVKNPLEVNAAKNKVILFNERNQTALQFHGQTDSKHGILDK